MRILDNKKGASSIVMALDVIGFVLLVIGGALIRFSKDEVISILGGFVLAGGVTIISITRIIGR
ncbi:MAG: hypothetical protein AABX65_02955 [Nanoarchaeota archaeon]